MRALSPLYYAFCALLLGLGAALLVSLSVWLEMRVHNRYIVLGFIIAGLIYGIFKGQVSVFALIFSEISLFLIAIWLNKQELIFYLMKESYLEFLNVSQIRYIFATLYP